MTITDYELVPALCVGMHTEAKGMHRMCYHARAWERVSAVMNNYSLVMDSR